MMMLPANAVDINRFYTAKAAKEFSVKKKVFAKTKTHVFLFGMLAVLLAFGGIAAGCDTGGGGSTSTGGGNGDPGTRAFSVSGFFTKSAEAGSSHINPHGETNPIEQDQTVISVTSLGDGSYEYIACYPKYVPNEDATVTPFIGCNFFFGAIRQP
jgi:hypothetical protein